MAKGSGAILSNHFRRFGSSIAIKLGKAAAIRGFVAIDVGKGIIIMWRDLEGVWGRYLGQ